jgi:bifunctional DNA-binding transcriptional regulator/antitoxin component of YhaV-PrlF toxin-antitoxin module
MIPRQIREALGIQPGDKLAWHLSRDGVLLCRHKPSDPQRQTLDTVSAVLSRQ